MTAIREQTATTPPRILVRSFWKLHRAAYRITGGRFGLSRPEKGAKFGMLRITTIGRRSGKSRVTMLGYYEDGPNLVTLAMNGWGDTEPAWWLNLQAKPDATIVLADGPRQVQARAASGAERDRLWAKFRDYPGWGEDIDALAARRPMETAVVVFEPQPGMGGGSAKVAWQAEPGRGESAGSAVETALVSRTDDDRRRRLRLRHLWIVPGLAIAIFGNGEAQRLGVGIAALVAFGIAPDLPRLLGLGQPHVRGQMPARAVRAFNLAHHPVAPLVVIVLAVTGVLPPIFYVASLVWLGHIVIGLGVGDRVRDRDGFLRPLWTVSRAAGHPAAPDAAGVSTSAEIAV